MFRFIRHWLDRRVLARHSITATEWEHAFADLPLLDHLSDAERERLCELAVLFLHHKSIDGARGLDITRRMSLVIALQACLPVLALGLECYQGWSGVVVYPSGFVSERVERDEYGVEHYVSEDLSGEAWLQGPVILSWDDTAHAGYEDGYNLVIHEFAHKLDMQNGRANGFPPLHSDMDAGNWTRALSAGFERFQALCERGEDIGIDCYAASSPAEFFAVLSETFFEQPELLVQRFEDVFVQMRLYYRQDPLARKSASRA